MGHIKAIKATLEYEKLNNDSVMKLDKIKLMTLAQKWYSKLHNIAETKTKPVQTEVTQRTRVKRINATINQFVSK